MKKRFLYPIWKFDKIEKELATLEENGWRLNKIYGIRNFEFIKSKPKASKYFFTYSIPREKVDMYSIENTLKQKFGATKIQGKGPVEFYRITKDVELDQQMTDRNILLQYFLYKRIIINVLGMLLLLIPMVLGFILNPEKFLNDIINQPFEWVVISCCLALVISCLIYNIVGHNYMKSKNIRSKNDYSIEIGDWYDKYKRLDLRNGEIKFICDDDQDMIEIRYDDGMLIDVGYVEEDRKYYITVVESDDKNGWQNPLEIVEVSSKEVLPVKIQNTVMKYR